MGVSGGPQFNSVSVKYPMRLGLSASGATCVAATSSALVTNDGANQSLPLAMDSCTSNGIWPPRVVSSENEPSVLKPHWRNRARVAVPQAAMLGYWAATASQYGHCPVTWSVSPSAVTVSMPEAKNGAPWGVTKYQ